VIVSLAKQCVLLGGSRVFTPVAFWIVFGVILMVIEILTPTFFIFWFGLGSLAAAVVAYFHENTLLELLTFVIVSAILVLSTRRLAKKLSGEQIRSINVDDIVGKEALVIERVDNKAGTAGVVKVNGDMWRAVSFDDNITFEKGELAVIEKVEGAHVVIRQIEKQKKNENEQAEKPFVDSNSDEDKGIDKDERNEDDETDSQPQD
jgi:membrane protein implicated in regulation of membrane protease activity